MIFKLPRCPLPFLVAMGGVALVLVGLLVGYEPVGEDPAWMYRPIKGELAKALRSGTLPFWSDRFGVGVPLVAESHAAAFYPPNWVLYRVLDVAVAYRVAMWGHFAAIGGLAYLYARTLGLRPWGAALAAVSFSLCGFQAAHAVHEPFYHALPYLLLGLTIAEGYLASGGIGRLAALALVLGAGLTVGHFQIQAWTAGLIVLTGIRRGIGREAPWRRVGGLVAAVAWAAGVAAVQIAMTWELVDVVGFSRSMSDLVLYSFPVAHWAQLGFPGIFHQAVGPSQAAYWRSLGTSAREVCLHVGVLPLIFAGIGLAAVKPRAIVLWCWIAALGLVMACLPLSRVQVYAMLVRIPGLDLFRCPARYTMLTSLGLCLLAGVGFDRAVSRPRFWSGFALAAAFGAAAAAWIAGWPSGSGIFSDAGGDLRIVALAAGLLYWVVALAMVAAWRSGRVPDAVLVLAALCELAFWFYNGPTRWGRVVPIPGSSPVMERLAREADVGLIGGIVCDVPVLAGLTTGDPYLGIPAPGPNRLLDMMGLARRSGAATRALLPRLGVTHGIFATSEPFLPAEVLYRGRDAILDAVMPGGASSGPRQWRLDRYSGAFPAVRVATRARVVADWPAMLDDPTALADPAVAFHRDAALHEGFRSPRGGTGRVLRWDGQTGEVEHDGDCELVIRRACYPGWRARLDDDRDARIVPADGGLQAIALPGSGVTRVALKYRPTLLWPAAAVSLAAVVLAAGGVIATAVRGRAAG